MKQKVLSKYFSSVSKITNTYYYQFFKKFIKQNSDILDFGCGTGELLDMINVQKKIGIEVNPYSILQLKKKKIVYCKSLNRLKNKKFDLIFALSVLDHLENPFEILKNFKKYLKKNGKLILIVRQDSFNQNLSNSKYKENLYSWSILSFSNILLKLNYKIIKYDFLKFTLIPYFQFFFKILTLNQIIFLSKFYYFLNFRDRRIFFICKK